MKAMCSVAVIILAIQALCAGNCLGTYFQGMAHNRIIGLPPCHGGMLPSTEDRSDANIDPCIQGLAVESKNVPLVAYLTFPVLVHEAIVLEARGPVLNAVSSDSETTASPSLRLVLRI